MFVVLQTLSYHWFPFGRQFFTNQTKGVTWLSFNSSQVSKTESTLEKSCESFWIVNDCHMQDTTKLQNKSDQGTNYQLQFMLDHGSMGPLAVTLAWKTWNALDAAQLNTTELNTIAFQTPMVMKTTTMMREYIDMDFILKIKRCYFWILNAVIYLSKKANTKKSNLKVKRLYLTFKNTINSTTLIYRFSKY